MRKLRIKITVLLFLIPIIFWAQCNINVDAGPDEAICAPGGDVPLSGMISGPYLFPVWTPDTGLSDPTILDPIATVATTTTYTLTGWANDPTAPELIQNADFQAGNTSFTSEYTYGDPSNPLSLFPEATYTVVTSPGAVHSNFPACDDHTIGDGTGQMMVVNGSQTIDVNIWCQSIIVDSDTYYNIGAWIATVIPVAPAALQFSINGTVIGDIFNASITPCLWEEFDANWYSTTAGSVELCITNQNTAQSGNDFAIDDISFKPLCKVEDEVTITVNPSDRVYIAAAICAGDFYELGGQFFDMQGSYFDIPVIDIDGCQQLYDLDLDLIEITILGTMEAELTCQQDTLEISVDAFTSLGVLFYDWFALSGNIVSDPSQSFILVDQPGTYRVIITAEFGGMVCDEILFLNVTEQVSNPIAQAGSDGIIDCNNTTFELNGLGSSAGPNFNFEWSDAIGTNISNNLMHPVNAAGIYILTVVDQITGCTSSDTANIVLLNTPPTVMAGPDGILDCANSSFTLNSMGSSVGSEYSYIWRNSNGDILSNNPNQNINSVDRYSLTIVNNDTGCMASDTAHVTASTDLPDISAGTDVILDCGVPDYLIQPTINNNTPNIVATWSTINGNIINFINNAINVNQSGDYFVIALDTTTFCAGRDTIRITFTADLPDVTIDLPDTITCAQSAINIFGHYLGDPSTVDFSWSTNGGSFNAINDSTITATSAGQYTLTVNDPIRNCTNTEAILVSENMTEPFTHAGTDDVINCADTLLLSGNLSSLGNNYSYQWTTADGHIISGDQTLNPQIDQAGIYVLTVTDIRNGCTSSDGVVIVSNQTLPEVFINNPETINCDQSIITLIGSSTNNSNPLLYTWSTLDGNIISDSALDSILIDQGGTYSLRIQNLTTNCSNSTSILVSEDLTYPSIDAGPEMTLYCGQPSAQLMGSILENRPSQISWSHTNGNILSGEETLNPVVDRAANYYVTVAFDNGCSSTDSVQVFIDQDLPQAIIVEPSVLNCTILDQVLNASGSSQGTQFTASWSLSNGSFSDLSNLYAPTINSGGSFVLEIINTSNNCASYDTVQVLLDTISPIIIITSNDINCIDTTAVIDASRSNGQNIITYLWTGNNIDQAQSTSPVISTTESGTYNLQVADQVNGCIAQEITTITEDYNVDAYNIDLPSSYETGIGQEVQLNASINFDPDLISSITWMDTSTLKNYSGLDPIACPETDTDYNLLIAINDQCQITAETRVRVSESEVYIPNIFTPDNDGTNDGFTVYGGQDLLQIDQMLIVNRWGDIVYNQTNVPSSNPTLGWDGTFNGKPQPNGVYVYYIQVRYTNNQVKTFSGDVTSMR